MSNFRRFYKGSLYKIFDSLDEEEEWTKVRVGAETCSWYELVEAFHTAYMRPRTIKLAVQVQDATTEELVKGMAKPTEIREELLRYEVFQEGVDHDCTLCNGTGKQQVPSNTEKVESQSMWHQIRNEVKRESTVQAVEAWLTQTDKAGIDLTPALKNMPSLRRTISRAKYFSQIGQMEGECVPCWLCKGTGKVSAWLQSYEAPGEHANEKGDAVPCLICGDISHYGMSTECTHFFCKDCLSGTLEAILEMGQFPAYCPGCRAEAGLEGLSKPLAGRIEGPALTFLQRRGVISLDMQFRFLKQQNPGGKDYFRCPAKCGNYLLDRDPEYMHVPRGETEAEGFLRMMRLGECPCGAKVCVNCHQQVFPDQQGKHNHECPDLSAAADADEATLAEMGRVGRKCPNCGNFIEKNGGCNIVMCGTDAHGRLADALAHGGCGFQFEWDTGQAANTSYIGLDGQEKYGFVGHA